MTRFETLLEIYQRDELTTPELEEFLDLLRDNAGQLEEAILQDLQQRNFTGLTSADQRERMLTHVLEQTRRRKTFVLLMTRRAAAAAILLLLGSAWFYFGHKTTVTPSPHNDTAKNDVTPGKDQATLTLADGTTVNLDSAGEGQLSRQGNTSVIKQKNGQLVYETPRQPAAASPVIYNMITTPKGGRYQLLLPDGSKVILNSASSLRYPTAFTESHRSVQLTGEAYFEITKDRAKPFTVTVNGMEVHVLGTRFNIMAYNDEPTVTTTLVDGSVQVQKGTQTQTLKPGQEAVLNNTDGELSIKEANIDKALAWTTGFFKFDHSDLRSIMREVSRWYDIDIVYETTNTGETYGGRIRRDLNLSVLIKFLESNGIHHFRIEGKNLIVLP